MSNMLTVTGVNAFMNFATQGQKTYSIPAEQIDRLLDTLLINVPAEGILLLQDTLYFRDSQITVEEAIEKIAPHIDRLRLEAIKNFEKYFSSNANAKDPENLVRDFNGGAEDAKRVFRQMGIFPVEAISVRTELAHPDLMRVFAADTDQTRTNPFAIVRAILGHHTLITDEGPFLPPIHEEKVVMSILKDFPRLDRMAKDIVAGVQPMPKSTPGH